jgi:hypothetical protein
MNTTLSNTAIEQLTQSRPMKTLPVTAVTRAVGIALLLVSLESLLPAAPLGAAFTYQGRLTDGGSPATGIYDLRFTAPPPAPEPSCRSWTGRDQRAELLPRAHGAMINSAGRTGRSRSRPPTGNRFSGCASREVRLLRRSPPASQKMIFLISSTSLP